MRTELEKFGVSLDVFEDSASVRGGLCAPRAALSSHNDHRIAMALAVLCTVTGGEIEGVEAAAKSYPSFWDDLGGLGIKVEKYGS